MNKIILIIVVILVIIIGGYFLLKNTSEVAEEKKTVEEKTVSETFEGKEIVVIGTEFNFNPSSIAVESKERIRIVFKNTGRALHNLVIEDLGLRTEVIANGEEDIIEFTAPAPGTYSIICSIPGHKEAGMIGRLEVK